MNLDLITLARECPGTILSIKVEDLINANNQLILNTKKEIEENVARSKDVSFLTREMVLERLQVAPSTLWRWKRNGYLVPVSVGGQYRYKSTDINDILEGLR